MKKILAFVLSASMCLSLLTVLSPAFAYEQDGEQIVQTRMAGPGRDDDPDDEIVHGQHDNN